MEKRINESFKITMNILILEDEKIKRDIVVSFIKSIIEDAKIIEVSNFCAYYKAVDQNKYDLIIVDLVVIGFDDDDTPKDMTNNIINTTRDVNSINYKTPVIALTRFDTKAEENFRELNSKDINVITYSEDDEKWKVSLKDKILFCSPPTHYDFVIICALQKEAEAFAAAGYSPSKTKVVGSLSYQELKVEKYVGVIVTLPRMGLVSAAITSTQAIEKFTPRLICMSGICGGIDGKSKIYDVVIPEICHQHDSGKWANQGFEPEVYSIQLEHELRLKINSFISETGLKEQIKKNITLNKKEFPEGVEDFDFNIHLAAASSGSSVIEDKVQVESIKGQQRKLTAFEMESFSVYEAARVSGIKPKYFSAKSIVDNGIVKGDDFHRVAAILSAKVVYEIIKSGLAFEK